VNVTFSTVIKLENLEDLLHLSGVQLVPGSSAVSWSKQEFSSTLSFDLAATGRTDHPFFVLLLQSDPLCATANCTSIHPPLSKDSIRVVPLSVTTVPTRTVGYRYNDFAFLHKISSGVPDPVLAHMWMVVEYSVPVRGVPLEAIELSNIVPVARTPALLPERLSQAPLGLRSNRVWGWLVRMSDTPGTLSFSTQRVQECSDLELTPPCALPSVNMSMAVTEPFVAASGTWVTDFAIVDRDTGSRMTFQSDVTSVVWSRCLWVELTFHSPVSLFTTEGFTMQHAVLRDCRDLESSFAASPFPLDPRTRTVWRVPLYVLDSVYQQQGVASVTFSGSPFSAPKVVAETSHTLRIEYRVPVKEILVFPLDSTSAVATSNRSRTDVPMGSTENRLQLQITFEAPVKGLIGRSDLALIGLKWLNSLIPVKGGASRSSATWTGTLITTGERPDVSITVLSYPMLCLNLPCSGSIALPRIAGYSSTSRTVSWSVWSRPTALWLALLPSQFSVVTTLNYPTRVDYFAMMEFSTKTCRVPNSVLSLNKGVSLRDAGIPPIALQTFEDLMVQGSARDPQHCSSLWAFAVRLSRYSTLSVRSITRLEDCALQDHCQERGLPAPLIFSPLESLSVGLNLSVVVSLLQVHERALNVEPSAAGDLVKDSSGSGKGWASSHCVIVSLVFQGEVESVSVDRLLLRGLIPAPCGQVGISSAPSSFSKRSQSIVSISLIWDGSHDPMDLGVKWRKESSRDLVWNAPEPPWVSFEVRSTLKSIGLRAAKNAFGSPDWASEPLETGQFYSGQEFTMELEFFTPISRLNATSDLMLQGLEMVRDLSTANDSSAITRNGVLHNTHWSAIVKRAAHSSTASATFIEYTDSNCVPGSAELPRASPDSSEGGRLHLLCSLTQPRSAVARISDLAFGIEFGLAVESSSLTLVSNAQGPVPAVLDDTLYWAKFTATSPLSFLHHSLLSVSPQYELQDWFASPDRLAWYAPISLLPEWASFSLEIKAFSLIGSYSEDCNVPIATAIEFLSCQGRTTPLLLSETASLTQQHRVRPVAFSTLIPTDVASILRALGAQVTTVPPSSQACTRNGSACAYSPVEVYQLTNRTARFPLPPAGMLSHSLLIGKQNVSLAIQQGLLPNSTLSTARALLVLQYASPPLSITRDSYQLLSSSLQYIAGETPVRLSTLKWGLWVAVTGSAQLAWSERESSARRLSTGLARRLSAAAGSMYVTCEGNSVPGSAAVVRDPVSFAIVATVQGSAGAVCTECPEGSKPTETSDRGECEYCPSGMILEQVILPGTDWNVTRCSNCPAGRSNPGLGASTCDLCPPGRFAGSPGSSACSVCQPGSTSVVFGATDCIACGPNDVYSPTTGSCVTCPAGEVPTSDGCRPCAAGYYLKDSECLPCQAGKFRPANSSSITCQLCPPGRYQASPGSDTCSECPRGTANNLHGQLECLACPPGTFQRNLASSECQACPAGQFSANSSNTIGCTPCSPGSSQTASAQSQCALCSVGKHQPLAGQATCVACSPGFAQMSQGGVVCDACEPGTYADTFSEDVCIQCPLGQFASAPASTSCESCARGTYASSMGSVVCTECPQGQFQDRQGQSECAFCTPGRASNSTSSSSCQSCAPGSVAPDFGQSQCSSCTQNLFSRPLGGRSCVSCLDDGPNPKRTYRSGYLFDAQGQTHCDYCQGPFDCSEQAMEVVSSGYWWNNDKYPVRYVDDLVTVTNQNASVYKCPFPRACLINSTSGSVVHSCLRGYEGVMCANCSQDTVDSSGNVIVRFVRSGVQCLPCDLSLNRTVSVIMGVTFVGFCIYLTVKSLAPAAATRDTSTLKWSTALSAVARLFITYVTTLSVLEGLSEILQQRLSSISASASRAFGFVSDSANIAGSPLVCTFNLRFLGSLAFWLVLPLAFGLLLFLLFTIRFYSVRWMGWTAQVSQPFCKALWEQSPIIFSTYVSFFFIFYTYIAQAILTAFVWSTDVEDDRWVELDYSVQIVSDGSLTPLAKITMGFAAAGFLAYITGLPVLLWLRLRDLQGKLTDPLVKRAYGFLYDGYRLGLQYQHTDEVLLYMGAAYSISLLRGLRPTDLKSSSEYYRWRKELPDTDRERPDEELTAQEDWQQLNSAKYRVEGLLRQYSAHQRNYYFWEFLGLARKLLLLLITKLTTRSYVAALLCTLMFSFFMAVHALASPYLSRDCDFLEFLNLSAMTITQLGVVGLHTTELRPEPWVQSMLVWIVFGVNMVTTGAFILALTMHRVKEWRNQADARRSSKPVSLEQRREYSCMDDVTTFCVGVCRRLPCCRRHKKEGERPAVEPVELLLPQRSVALMMAEYVTRDRTLGLLYETDRRWRRVCTGLPPEDMMPHLWPLARQREAREVVSRDGNSTAEDSISVLQQTAKALLRFKRSRRGPASPVQLSRVSSAAAKSPEPVPVSALAVTAEHSERASSPFKAGLPRPAELTASSPQEDALQSTPRPAAADTGERSPTSSRLKVDAERIRRNLEDLEEMLSETG
jgi:hypothetical protein